MYIYIYTYIYADFYFSMATAYTCFILRDYRCVYSCTFADGAVNDGRQL